MATRDTPKDAPENWAGKPVLTGTLLDGVAAVDDGEWIDVANYGPISVHTFGITTATVQIRGSNADAKPNATDDEIQIGTDITADAISEITVPLKWLKAKVSAYTSGAITSKLLAHGRG